MSLNITSAKDLTEKTATYLIYGSQGVGKTSSIKHLPGKTLVVDIDKSSRVLKGEENIDIVSIDTHNIWESWVETAAELIKNKELIAEYDNLVIDNISELFRSALANLGRVGKNNRVPAMSDYQRVDFVIIDSLRALKKLPIRLFFTAWEEKDTYEAENGQTFSQMSPEIRRTIKNNFLGLCDVVARLVVAKRDDEEVRGFILQPTNEVVAKNRLDDRSGCPVEELVMKE